MTDIKSALAQLRAARGNEELQNEAVADLSQSPRRADSVAAAVEAEAQRQPALRGEVKTLAGRVPLLLHRELTRALLDAADELRVSRVNVDEALEAAMRLVLRDPHATQLWYAQLRDVRRERREG